MKSKRVIAADTHTPEYLLHKYWARKPHNIIADFIENLVPDGGIIVDPFCGSGVVLCEAKKQNKIAYGFDINPIACLISKVLIAPPDLNKFQKIVLNCLDKISREVSESYCVNGKNVRYCVHAIIPKCSKCNKVFYDFLGENKLTLCPVCNGKIKYNLESLVDTKVISIIYEGEKKIDFSPSNLEKQKKKSEVAIFSAHSAKYSYEFAENRRILAYKGMKTSALFTKRNFSILSHLADEFSKIQDPQIKDAAQLLLSSCIAQCSRLIAYRNNLKTGGPAWSIPGFWVPNIHLETNPLIHLRARLQKFCAGISILLKHHDKGQVQVEKVDARAGLKKLQNQGIKADLIFFDPPYGDNVPYVEFSSIWNSFLNDFQNPEDDISVSDRLVSAKAWEKYDNDLETVVLETKRTLKRDGHLLITFNNNDMRAWSALLKSLQKNDLRCTYVAYQIPAVISAKAQKSIEGSYISDLYSVFIHSATPVKQSLEDVIQSLVSCAKFRGGVLPANLALRTMLIAWLKNNVAAELLYKLDDIQRELFEENARGLHLKGYSHNGPSEFDQLVRKTALEHLSYGTCNWNDLYLKIANTISPWGIPSHKEVLNSLEDFISIENKRCKLLSPMQSEQLSLF